MSGWKAPRSRGEWRGVLRPGRWLWLRAPVWGVALAALVLVAVWVVQLGENRLGLDSAGLASLMRLGLGVALMMGVYALAVRLGERRRVDELAPQRLPREFCAGLAGGGLGFCIVMGWLLLGGWYTLDNASPGPPWKAFGAGLGAGTIEELLFRGVLMRLLWEAFGLPVGLAVSAIVFGLAHLINPQHSIAGAVSIIVEAGVVLGALFALTGRLWACIGVHAGWNFTQGYVFGADVSGIDLGGHWLHAVPADGAPWLMTGGAFGPEASVPAVAVGGLAGASVLFSIWRRGAAGGAG